MAAIGITAPRRSTARREAHQKTESDPVHPGTLHARSSTVENGNQLAYGRGMRSRTLRFVPVALVAAAALTLSGCEECSEGEHYCAGKTAFYCATGDGDPNHWASNDCTTLCVSTPEHSFCAFDDKPDPRCVANARPLAGYCHGNQRGACSVEDYLLESSACPDGKSCRDDEDGTFCVASTEPDALCAGNVFSTCDAGGNYVECRDGLRWHAGACDAGGTCQILDTPDGRYGVCALSPTPDPRCTASVDSYCDAGSVNRCFGEYLVRRELCVGACALVAGVPSCPGGTSSTVGSATPYFPEE